jgi:hypothetical protein
MKEVLKDKKWSFKIEDCLTGCLNLQLVYALVVKVL